MKLGKLLKTFCVFCGSTVCRRGKQERRGYNPPPMGISHPDKPAPAPPHKHQGKAESPNCVGKPSGEIMGLIETTAFLLLLRRHDATLEVALVWDDEQSLATQLIQAFDVPENDFGPAQAHGIGRMDVSITIKRAAKG